MPDSGRQQGFTLLDIVVTLAVFSLVGLITVGAVANSLDTYRRKMATQFVVSQLRMTQSLAVTRGGVFALHWGGDPGTGRSTSEFRIVRDTDGACSLPAPTAPLDGVDVVRDWKNLDDDFSGMRITSIQDDGGYDLPALMFDSMGSSVSPCTTASFPLHMQLQDQSGRAVNVEVRLSGVARIQ